MNEQLTDHRLKQLEGALERMGASLDAEREARQKISTAYATVTAELKNTYQLANQNAKRYDKLVWWILGLFVAMCGTLATALFL